METPSPIFVLFHKSLLPFAGDPSENKSLINTTPWPIKQSLPMVTSSQIKEFD